jgi:hypothetical protein
MMLNKLISKGCLEDVELFSCLSLLVHVLAPLIKRQTSGIIEACQCGLT